MKTIEIIAENAREARKIAARLYPGAWTFVRRDSEATHGTRSYIFKVQEKHLIN